MVKQEIGKKMLEIARAGLFEAQAQVKSVEAMYRHTSWEVLQAEKEPYRIKMKSALALIDHLKSVAMAYGKGQVRLEATF